MRRWWIICIVLVLTACSQSSQQNETTSNEKTETIIDWIDFIKVNGEQYDALYTVAISDDAYIGEKIGEVAFKVSDNVNDPNYVIKNGDAAFWEEGTEIYSVKEKPDLAAIKDEQEINGYRLYQKEPVENKWSFEHVSRDDIMKIEVWKGAMNPKLLHSLDDMQEMMDLFDILEQSSLREQENNMHEENPDVYDIVFYQDGPIASHYPLFHQKNEWYWLPWEEEILADEIEQYIEVE